MALRPAGSRPLGRAVSEGWYDADPGLGRRLLLGCLAPASWAYGAATRLRTAAYDRGWIASARAPIPVVSVGNVVVGGAGKTPAVLEVAGRLSALGHTVAVVSRGYGAEETGPRVVSDGQTVRLDARRAGDEPHLIARRCPGMVVLAGPDRAALVTQAAAEFGATVAVLDDGLQHRRLQRDLELVVIDASAPVGNGRLFPRGPLREGLGALSRAHLVWLSRVDETPDRPFASTRRLDALLASAACPIVRTRHEADALCDGRGEAPEAPSALEGRRVVALVGIGRPSSFLAALARLGARVVGTHLFGDHHPYTGAELAAVLEDARSRDAVVVTTEKDAARLSEEAAARVRVLRIRSEIVEGSEDLDALLRSLPRPAGEEPGASRVPVAEDGAGR